MRSERRRGQRWAEARSLILESQRISQAPQGGFLPFGHLAVSQIQTGKQIQHVRPSETQAVFWQIQTASSTHNKVSPKTFAKIVHLILSLLLQWRLDEINTMIFLGIRNIKEYSKIKRVLQRKFFSFSQSANANIKLQYKNAEHSSFCLPPSSHVVTSW